MLSYHLDVLTVMTLWVMSTGDCNSAAACMLVSGHVQPPQQHVHAKAQFFGWYRYLSFVRGIVDSDTLPLQVSRESLQQHAALKTMKKKLVRKALDMIKKLADAETAFEAEDADSKSKHR